MSCVTKAKPAEKFPLRGSVLEFAPSGGAMRVDREAGVIHHVKLLGLESKHGYSYPPAVIQRARPLYDRAPVFIGHPPIEQARGERDPSEQFGWIENPVLEADGLYADLHFLKSHPMAGSICELAERAPDKIGMSHNADITRMQESEVHSIDRVRSVDLVCRPGTTRGIFESEGTMDPDEIGGGMGGMGGMGDKDPEAPVTEENPPAAAGEPDDDEANDGQPVDQAIDALLSQYLPLIKAAQPGARKKLAKELAGKIDNLIDVMAQGDAAQAQGGGEEEATEECDKTVKESAPSGRKPDWAGAMTALESAGVRVTATRVKAYLALQSADDRAALVNEFSTAAGSNGKPAAGTRPRSTPAAGSSVLESELTGRKPGRARGEPTKDELKKFAASMMQ